MPKVGQKIKRGVKTAGRGVIKGVKAVYGATPRIRHTTRYLDVFSPEQKAKSLREYSGSYNEIDGTLKVTDLIQNYKKERLKDLKEVKGPDGKPMSEKLASSDPILQRLEHELELTEATNTALEKFKKTVAEFNKVSHNPAEVASEIQKFRSQLVQEIKNQHEEEKNKLNDLLADTTFVNSLANKMGASGGQVEKLKSDMQTALKDSQEKELKKIEDALKDQVKKLHDAADFEQRRISTLASFYNSPHAKKMRADIDKLYEKNYKEDQGATISYGVSGLTTFKGINFKDIEHLQTVAGRDVTHDEKGGFSIQFPRIGFAYYHSGHDYVLYDLTSIAQMVRASGADKITLSVNYENNNDYAMELGRKAYEAALLAGFDPNTEKEKNIAIMVNNKLVKVEELFEKYPARRELMERKASNLKKEQESLIKNPVQAQRDLKDALQETKNTSNTSADNQLTQPAHQSALP
ncbi:hypothetical protein ACQUW5_07060 [Legionella sp. CNM-1927-20]|uniref:hypothetical protein n=1 Tax=Legionella sp. CNM-1927-20 TaxID=3422221 RepID=UPI00403A918B